MRIAFVDLVFAWPPTGGAQADLYHVIHGLHRAGFDVHLFASSYDFLWRFGSFEPDELPFPSTRLDFSSKTYIPEVIAQRFRDAVDTWRPDLVFVGFGRTLKPYLLQALSHYPIISRYYMYEHLCIRDFCLFYESETCPNDIWHTPDACWRCSWETWQRETITGRLTPYSDEYHRAKAYARRYPNLFRESLKIVRTLIVNNELARDRIRDFCSDVRIIPGGVEIERFQNIENQKKDRAKKVILFPGRADDPRKGLNVVLTAGRGLAQVRNDFEIWVTFAGDLRETPWLKNIGFVPHSRVPEIYNQADICVVPSVWDEPFGLVAIEAMAAALPVCATRCGGLAGIVQDGVTGFLFERGNAVQLALQINRLLDDVDLRTRMGLAGKKRVEEFYTWDAITEKHYIPLMEEFRA